MPGISTDPLDGLAPYEEDNAIKEARETGLLLYSVTFLGTGRITVHLVLKERWCLP